VKSPGTTGAFLFRPGPTIPENRQFQESRSHGEKSGNIQPIAAVTVLSQTSSIMEPIE
jgi:hypothetical protein